MDEGTDMTRFWNIHLRPSQDEYDLETASKGLIAIYWGGIGNLQDLSEKNDWKAINTELMTQLKQGYPKTEQSTLDRWRTTIRYFIWEMDIGDFVISSTLDNRCFLGIIENYSICLINQI